VPSFAINTQLVANEIIHSVSELDDQNTNINNCALVFLFFRCEMIHANRKILACKYFNKGNLILSLLFNHDKGKLKMPCLVRDICWDNFATARVSIYVQ
jgi:hypothetical protein